jgi:hypothetical protein
LVIYFIDVNDARSNTHQIGKRCRPEGITSEERASDYALSRIQVTKQDTTGGLKALAKRNNWTLPEIETPDSDLPGSRLFTILTELLGHVFYSSSRLWFSYLAPERTECPHTYFIIG